MIRGMRLDQALAAMRDAGMVIEEYGKTYRVISTTDDDTVSNTNRKVAPHYAPERSEEQDWTDKVETMHKASGRLADDVKTQWKRSRR